MSIGHIYSNFIFYLSISFILAILRSTMILKLGGRFNTFILVLEKVDKKLYIFKNNFFVLDWSRNFIL